MNKNKLILLGFLGLIAISFSFQSRFFEIAKQIEIYNNLFKTLNMNYIDEINPGDITKKAINNTLENLDPYTRFYNEQQMEDARIRREGEYGGIGISSFYSKDGIVIATIKEGFTADKAGLKAGDIITQVNNQNLGGLEKDLLSQVLKGIPNTPISMQINRAGKKMDFNLKLDKVIVNPVPFFDMVNEDTGYIVLTQFTSGKSTEDVKNAFFSLKEKGMKKLIFDLRSNPGGSLFDAINITNIFIPKGKKVVDTRGKTQANSRTYNTNKEGLDLDIPIVVLIDGRSASASEIVSGALQDYDRAVIMGERSFGKGLVQRYFELNYGTQMKATISKYYTPSGRCIQELDYANRDAKTGKVPKFSDGVINSFKTANGRTVYDGGGVTPDVKIPFSEKTEETEELLSSKAIFYFATEYVRNYPTTNIDAYSFTPTDFNEFKNFLIHKDTSFVTKQEKLFHDAYKSVEKNNQISSEYNQILTKLRTEKVAEISKNEDVLISKIQDEILEQYFYEKGVFQHHLKNDATIKKAVDLLNNSSQYNKILGR
ncbi:S41 family peptidase [Tenacibaculum sp. IB213877]|uniref:S41 family peptidase n=1 Tax=Tenacibaculum sp. IB213877 TaxID=3097351 RepID=UPI002A5AA089|nr:S41 family peptidase [Tenacibaculum sp. IB213877]MDY0780403.1 S41 family peptidase [Tenacibaculum sp. IB213877]